MGGPYRIERPSLFLHAAITEFAVQASNSGIIVDGTIFPSPRGGYGSSQSRYAQVTQAIHANIIGNLLDAATGGNQFHLLWDVYAKVTRVAQRRRAGTQVNLLSSVMAQSRHQALHGVAAYN